MKIMVKTINYFSQIKKCVKTFENSNKVHFLILYGLFDAEIWFNCKRL